MVLQSQVVATLVTEETLDMTHDRHEEMIAETLEIEDSIDLNAKRLPTMIGNVKSVIILTFHLELNVIDAENQSLVVEQIIEAVVHEGMTVQDEIIEVMAETEGHAETTVQVEIVKEVTEVAVNAESEGHAENGAQVEIIEEATETVDHEEKVVGAQSETRAPANSVVLEVNHRVMHTTEDHNPLTPAH